MLPNWPGRINGNDGHNRIASFLTMDIQRAPDWGRLVLGQVNDIIAGHKDCWEMAMNAYILKLSKEKCEISPVYEEYGEGSVCVSIEDLQQALCAWIKQIDASLNQ